MLKKALLLVAASAVSVSAFAGGLDQAPATAPVNDAHAYAGAQVGYVAHYGFDKAGKSDTNGPLTFNTYSKDQGSFGARVFAGYMFDKFLGVELGAGTFGAQNAAINLPVGGVTTAKGTEYGIHTRALVGFDADVVGNLALTDSMFAFAKAGMALVDFNTKDDTNGVIAGDDSLNVTNWNWMPRAELGLGYNLTKSMAVTVSYAQYFGIDRSTTVRSDTKTLKKAFSSYAPSFGMAALGLTYSF